MSATVDSTRNRTDRTDNNLKSTPKKSNTVNLESQTQGPSDNSDVDWDIAPLPPNWERRADKGTQKVTTFYLISFLYYLYSCTF